MIGRVGYFVHHQGRGHAERAAAIVNALPGDVDVTLFSARDDIFPALGANIRVHHIPSLFEPPVDLFAAPALSAARTPSTMHCAPLGWPSITRAVATLTGWFDQAGGALFITDVSAELAQLARIASVPCVTVMLHGDRDDPGHVAAHESAIGILAPYAPALEQPGRPDWMRRKTCYAPGIGVPPVAIDRAGARARLGLPAKADIVLVVAGGGGSGTPAPSVALGARAEPDTLWLTIGPVEHQWHETSPDNLVHKGWVDDPATYMAAADRIVSSAGDTTVHMIATAGRPWIVIPEWRYFDEQVWKARMLGEAGAAVALDRWPSYGASWASAWDRAAAIDLSVQRRLVETGVAARCAQWLMRLALAASGETWCTDKEAETA